MVNHDSIIIPQGGAIEWPTFALILAIYAGWLALTWFHADIAFLIWLPLAMCLGTLWGSLQHEILHGHPTRNRALNTALATPPFWLWLPFERFRQTHLRHHHDERLTDPLDDPESRYWDHKAWQSLSPMAQRLVTLQGTLLGRLTIGPFWSIGIFLCDEARVVMSGDRNRRAVWLWHGVWVCLTLLWVLAVCDMPLWRYLLGFVIAPTALTFVRSFAEHKATDTIEKRTAIVENAWILGGLFLFNNLHFVHHSNPRLPWYKLPTFYKRHRERLLVENGGFIYQGYSDVFRRFFWSAHDTTLHPRGRAPLRCGTVPDERSQTLIQQQNRPAQPIPIGHIRNCQIAPARASRSA